MEYFMIRSFSSFRKGFSLVETMIALIIAVTVSLAFVVTVILMIRQNAANKAQLLALETADYYQGLALAADYKKIGTPDVSDDDFEAQFKATEQNPLTVIADPSDPEDSARFDVFFEVTGFGEVSSASASTITASLPGGDSWEANEWEHNYLTITKGKGKGQIMRIKSNGTNSMNLTADLTGDEDVEFKIIPDSSSHFVINNGKTVRLTVTWGEGESHETIHRTVLLRHRGD